MDLAEELPTINEKVTMNTSVGWDPFSNITNNTSPQIKETNNNPQTTLTDSQQNGTKNQPDLFDLIYTDKIPEQEVKADPKMNLNDVFVDTKQKEAEERFKKMTLLEYKYFLFFF